MGGWIRAWEDKFNRESMLIRAVGGGVDNSSFKVGADKSTREKSLGKSVAARYSLPPVNVSKSFVRFCSIGVRGYTSYGANRGD